MKLEYSMNISNESYSMDHTPGIQSQKLPFYIDGCGHFYALNGYFTEREGLDNYLLIYTVSGQGFLKYNQTEHDLLPNQAVVFYCLNQQYYKAVSKEPWVFKWIHFNGTSVKDYYELINNDIVNPVIINEGCKIENLIEGIYDSIKFNDYSSDLKSCSQMMELITEIITSKLNPQNDKNYLKHKAEINKVVEFIQHNYNREINIDDFTNVVLLSKFYFLRLFKSYTGQSPYEYLITYRINVSKSLLKYTDSSIFEISRNVGFNDVNNFIRCFKRLIGTTPGIYRKKMG